MTRFVRGQYTRAVILFLALVLYSATGYLYFELSGNPELTWGDAFWWSVVTMTTVGYGDFFPSTTLGRMLVGVPTMLMGIGILGYILSVTATAMLCNLWPHKHTHIVIELHIMVHVLTSL